MNYSPIHKIFLSNFLQQFQKKVSKEIKNIEICDIGAGTGYYSSLFLIKNKKYWKNINYTFVEPNRDMINILKKKVPQFTNKNILPLLADEAIEKMSPQDIFIFQRCLYAFYPSTQKEKYFSLAKKTFQKTKKDGVIIVSAITNTYDIDIIKKTSFQNRKKLGLSEKKFKELFPILETTLDDFNNQVLKKEINIMSEDLIINMFSNAGFSFVKKEKTVFIFKK